MRPSIVLTIARRDLAIQLRGRRAWVLPLIAAVLLVPLASVPIPLRSAGPAAPPQVVVSGEVPDALDAHPDIARGDHGVPIRRAGDALVVRADPVPAALRRALDQALDPSPPPAVAYVAGPTMPLPGRTLLLALVAASLLTGAVSESLPGERGQRTLEALLTAAIRRDEIIFGKGLAWGGIGAIVSLAAGFVAIGSGLATLGPWILALPLVAPATVALGLFLVRHTADLVGGATVSLRVLPAVLSTLGLVAWGVGLWSPALGASIPLGGALVAAGDTWPGWGPPALAAAMTGGVTLGLLIGAARGLEREVPREDDGSKWRAAALIGWLAAASWGLALGPTLWAPAGNPALAANLSPAAGVLASALALLMLSGVVIAGPGGWRRVRLDARASVRWAWALLLAPALFGIALVPEPAQLPVAPSLVARLDLALHPGAAGVAVAALAVVAQEVSFRGLLPRALARGHNPGLAAELGAVAVWTAIAAPHAPVTGALIGLALSALARATGSIVPGLAARLLAVAALAPFHGFGG
jgi:membrane protease YdiL (CAAX protease family)